MGSKHGQKRRKQNRDAFIELVEKCPAQDATLQEKKDWGQSAIGILNRYVENGGDLTKPDVAKAIYDFKICMDTFNEPSFLSWGSEYMPKTKSRVDRISRALSNDGARTKKNLSVEREHSARSNDGTGSKTRIRTQSQEPLDPPGKKTGSDRPGSPPGEDGEMNNGASEGDVQPLENENDDVDMEEVDAPADDHENDFTVSSATTESVAAALDEIAKEAANISASPSVADDMSVDDDLRASGSAKGATGESSSSSRQPFKPKGTYRCRTQQIESLKWRLEGLRAEMSHNRELYKKLRKKMARVKAELVASKKEKRDKKKRRV